MNFSRRGFISAASGTVALGLLGPAARAHIPSSGKFSAIAFDAFPIFDPRPIAALTEELFPGRGQELGNLWRTRQFEYTWLRTISQRYADFARITADALAFAARTLKLELPPEKRDRLVGSHFKLKAWPDVLPVLQQLQHAGIRLGFLSNFTRAMLEANLANSGLEGYFEEILSTDRVQAFKPDPRAYRMGTEAFRLPPEKIVFAAFAGWDAAGARTFGYPTFWVNRQNAAPEELGAPPDGTGNLADLAGFVLGAPSGVLA